MDLIVKEVLAKKEARALKREGKTVASASPGEPEPAEKKDEVISELLNQMTEDTKQFIIKVLAVGVILVVLYFVFSPYQTCKRDYDGSGNREVVFCGTNTSW